MSKYFVFLLVIYIFSSCNNHVIEGNVAFKDTIDLDHAIKKEKILLSSLVESPKVIILETREGVFLQDINSLEFYKGKFYILDNQSNALYVFSQDGKFLWNIGAKGKGKGEYTELSDFSIDRDNDVIYLWDEALDMAFKYNVNNRCFISAIKTKRNGQRSFWMLYSHGKLYVNRTSTNEDVQNYALKEIDPSTGIQTDSLLNSDEYNNGWNEPLRLPYSFFYSKNSEQPKYIEMFSNKLVSIAKEGIEPLYFIKSNEFISQNEILSLKKKCRANNLYDLSEIQQKDCIYMISRYIDMKEIVLFHYSKGINNYVALYNTESKKTQITPFLSNDYIGGNNNFATEFCYSDHEGVYAYINTEEIPYFRDYIIDKGVLSPDIDQYDRLQSITHNNNPIIFFYKYK